MKNKNKWGGCRKGAGRKNITTGIKGIFHVRKGKVYRVQFCWNGEILYFGEYKSLEDAVRKLETEKLKIFYKNGDKI